MRFPTPLVPARLIRRYKRFLADCVLEDGREVTAHCANPGSMLGLADPGTRVWLEPNDNPRRKLRFAWALVDHADGHFTGVDTSAANRIVREGIEAGAIPVLSGYNTLRAEVPYGRGSRVDFLIGHGDRRTYVEVKSVTLSRRAGLAEFPDSVTARGARHLEDLAEVAQAGHRAILFYLVQRTDCTSVAVAADIDPTYAQALARARAAGVIVLSHAARIDPQGITLGPAIFTKG